MAERVLSDGTDVYRRPPSTQNGETQDLSARHVQERPDGASGLVPNTGGPDQTPPTTPLEDGTENGMWNSGQNIDGWHPAK